MQVDPTPMNVGDGGMVTREIGAVSMVGNPPQTLPPELRRDVPLIQQNRTTTDCKTPGNVCSDPSNFNHCPVAPPTQQHNNSPQSGPSLISSDRRTDNRPEVPKTKVDGAGVFLTHQWPCGTKVSPEDHVNPSHSSVASNKKPHTQTQSVISVPAGFQCSTLFKPGHPVAFLPNTNFSSPLCKITLPPALGQIAALREATASQFQKEGQARCTSAGVTPLLRTYPYQFSTGRCPAPEKKTPSSMPKLKCNSVFSSKTSKSGGEHKPSMAPAVASPTVAVPVQHPAVGAAPPTHFTLSPTPALCSGPALTSIPTQNLLLKQVEKGPSHHYCPDKASVGFLKLKAVPAAKNHSVVCPTEVRDLPLDLSSKSKRPNAAIKVPPNTADTTERLHNVARQKAPLHPKRLHMATYGSAAPYPLLPNTHRNGAHQKQTSRLLNHQGLEPNPSWVRGSPQDPINNLPGTYVGVASPILASTLRSKDGKGTFEEEFQTFARQETISIVDQGEHLAARGKKASFIAKGNQHVHGIMHPATTSPAVTQSCPSKGAFTTALPGSATSYSHQKSGNFKAAIQYSPAVIKPLWQQPALLPHQGASVQRKVIQGTSKVKASDDSAFQIAHQSPPRIDDEKWDGTNSPLSNLESIVKLKALETTALTCEGFSHPAPVASRKPDAVSYHTVGQDALFHKTAAFGCPPYRTAENKDRPFSQGDSQQVMSKLERTSVTEPLEKSTEKHVRLGENSGGKDLSVKSANHTHAFESSGTAGGNRMDSKLAQELEGSVGKEERSASLRLSPRAALEGIALSILTGQCAGVAEVEKTNGTKEQLATKPKATVPKPKKSPSPKKPAKEKIPPYPSKKATLTVKKKQDQEVSSVKKEAKNKKMCTPVLEPSVSVAGSDQTTKTGKSLHKEKGCHSDNNQAFTYRPDDRSSPLPTPPSSATPVPISFPGKVSKEPAPSESSTPRLRRGRRRADEAHLDNWGFSAPSPVPPPSPPHPTSTPPQPVRRPRGRPRTNPRPDKADRARTSPGTDGHNPTCKKRTRCRNKKYQNGEYVIEKAQDGDEEGEERPVFTRQGTPGTDLRPGMYPRLSATLTCRGTSPESASKRPLFTRSGSVRQMETEASPEPSNKPSGKRKFKSKHLSDTDEPKKLKSKRCSLGKHPASVTMDDDILDAKKPVGLPATPKSSLSPPAGKKKGTSGRGVAPESPPGRAVPPEVRRLIVNKNAGETLLQRAARLGYQEVVLYCLEKDVREVNRRDNAGYTALHEACSRGWSHIVQVLLKHGADVNCSAQDGTRPIHDAVASDNLPVVWMLLNHGADPTLATYSGQTAVKLAQSPSMKSFLKEYFTDLEGRRDQDPSVPWDFYSSSVFETGQEACWEFLLSQRGDVDGGGECTDDKDSDMDCLLFEFSSDPLLPCYHVQVSLTQGFCNWFLLTDVLKRLKMSSRIFRARYPHLEVVSLEQAELWRQVSVSQVSRACTQPKEDGDREEGQVELVRCVPELQGLLGSSIHILHEGEVDEDEDRMDTATPCSR
ncbi:hypothetical protein UPYG_G00215530 [Umbra pygmaea]|uniref:BCL-6 corepressor PCGF1 binding domain-containing protein n=1 Tax=Umbra pygmaea TaxID=75934 RepID=A0ABD0WKQ4_UMBPY